MGHALNQIKLETDVAIQREAVKIMTSDFQDFDEVIIINSSDEEDEENVVLHPREVVDVDADTVPSHPPAGVRVRIPNVVWRFDELAGPKFGFYEEVSKVTVIRCLSNQPVQMSLFYFRTNFPGFTT